MLFCIACYLTACDQSSQSKEDKTNTTISYKKNDLDKIKWIEGKWRGLAGNEPFYEMYEFINDSTIKITTYQWDGKDSSKSEVDLLQWKDDAYYLGKEQNYKVTDISNAEIKMIPVKGSNDILWKPDGDSGWIAILAGKKATNTYHMKPFDPFKK